jgi:hypothetical protein
VELLAEPQARGAALVEADGDHAGAEVRGGSGACVTARAPPGDRVCGSASVLEVSMATSTPRPPSAHLSATPVLGSAASGSCAASAPSSSASSRRAAIGFTTCTVASPQQARHLRGQQPDRAEADDGDVVAQLDLRVVDGLQRDRAHAQEERRLERGAGRDAHDWERAAGGEFDVDRRLVAVRRARVHDVAGAGLPRPARTPRRR